MKFKVNKSKDAIQESSGSAYIYQSGVYDVEIKFASVGVSKNGAESINFNVDYNGNSQTIYGPYVTNKDGSVNEIGAKLINKLAIIAGMDEGDDFEIEQESHAVGKDNKEQDFDVITNFSDLPIKIQLQEEYSKIADGFPNAGDIRGSMVIKSFFREDGASAEEIVNETEVGKRLAIVEEKYADKVTYKDGLTAEDVTAWKKAKSDEAKGTKTPTPKASSTFKGPAGSVFK